MFVRSNVEYGIERTKHISAQNMAEMNSLPGNDIAQIFCKPDNYSWQQEFRIAIRPMNKKIGFLNIKKEPLLVDANRINQFMEVIS